MNLFFILLGKIFPLYINIVLGFLSTRFLKVDKNSIAALLVYILGPIVVFNATLSVKIDAAVAFMPLFFYALSSLIAFLALALFKRWWQDSTPNILAFTAGTGNTGYFGIPLAMILLDAPLADIFIFTVLSSLLYESSTGFYVTAKGSFSAKDSLNKVLKHPIIYAFIAGVLCNVLGFELPQTLLAYTAYFKGAFGILGMMMLGMGLEGLKKGSGDIDMKFIGISFFMKFICWPLMVLGVIFLDKSVFMLLNEELYKVMFLFSVVPLAGNTVTLAVLLKVKPEKASLAVLLSTVLSLPYIPLMLYFFGGF